jgi:hypothetical protein
MGNRKKIAIGIVLVLLSASIPVPAQQRAAATSGKTIIKDAAARRRLLGSHRFSLQWISWDYFGKAVVTDQRGRLVIRGVQRARRGKDFVRMEGMITRVDAKEFIFNGVIETRVSHNNDGNVCKREGEMTFKITQNRRYWRLQQMLSPCGDETDYVDIFFR